MSTKGRQGGRQAGTGNIPPLEKIRANRTKLEKMLLDKALAGDVDAIKACLELIDEGDKVEGDPAATATLPVIR